MILFKKVKQNIVKINNYILSIIINYMTSLNLFKKKKCDDYNTPLYVWKMLLDYLDLGKNTIIYEPFYNNGESKSYLGKLGYDNVIHENEDFFENYIHYNFDIILSNPPYSIKQNILKVLHQLDKPFVLIVPTAIISKLYIKNIFKDDIDKVQFIIPNRRLQFEVNGYNQKRCCFDTLFMCYKLELKRDIVYL